MRKHQQSLRLPRESLTQTLALIVLLVLGAIALAGPSGLLAWTENAHALEPPSATSCRTASVCSTRAMPIPTSSANCCAAISMSRIPTK
jgi:hypothetical protein